jgi:hypothetical protein
MTPAMESEVPFEHIAVSEVMGAFDYDVRRIIPEDVLIVVENTPRGAVYHEWQSFPEWAEQARRAYQAGTTNIVCVCSLSDLALRSYLEKYGNVEVF